MPSKRHLPVSLLQIQRRVHQGHRFIYHEEAIPGAINQGCDTVKDAWMALDHRPRGAFQNTKCIIDKKTKASAFVVRRVIHGNLDCMGSIGTVTVEVDARVGWATCHTKHNLGTTILHHVF